MNFGLSQSQYKILENELIEPLSKLNASVYIFGSRARGDHHPFSDVDILVKSTESIPSEVISAIKEALEESKLEVSVDIVEDSMLADSYRDKVESEKIKISS
jgi:predicted nucleotidyltransferase